MINTLTVVIGGSIILSLGTLFTHVKYIPNRQRFYGTEHSAPFPFQNKNAASSLILVASVYVSFLTSLCFCGGGGGSTVCRFSGPDPKKTLEIY
jgi:hypothetical protein